MLSLFRLCLVALLVSVSNTSVAADDSSQHSSEGQKERPQARPILVATSSASPDEAATPLTDALDPDAARNTLLEYEDLQERLARLAELEQQALQLAVDEPLKLGSIGSAILDLYSASQTGHYVLERFYAHVEAPDAATDHRLALEKIQAHMLATGTGTQDTPYTITTIYDAYAFARSQGSLPVGSIYQSTAQTPFGFQLVAQPDGAALRSTYFDLTDVLPEEQVPSDSAEQAAVNRATLLRSLATRRDTAAQAAIGRYLASVRKYDDAIDWLLAAARSDNVLANIALARIYLIQAEAASDEANKSSLRQLALENHMHAITLGSSESMFVLANLYLNDYYGEENRGAGVALLQQAAELEHVDSLLYLGHLHNAGAEVAKDHDLAANYYARAAALKNPQAILSYARFIAANPDKSTSVDIVDWLEDLSKQDYSESGEAMVALGNLHARGISTKRSTRKAIRWYKRAIRKYSEDPDIVNEVAWTLTVSDIDGLPRKKYAKRIMTEMMESNDAARARPEFLDTWAATYAAVGEFQMAATLQREAIEVATEQARQDVLPILEEHLEQFEAGESIIEKAP